MIRRIVYSLNVLLIGFCLFFNYSCQRSDKAVWITTSGDACKPNQWISFRKTVTITDSCNSEYARIAVDSKYWLWINDSLVVREGGLIRNANPRDTYYDSVQIGPYLKKGNNVICILLNYFGRKGANHNSSGKVGLYFESAHITSGKNWKVKENPAFYSLKKEYSNFRYAIQSTGYNANNAINWTSKAYNDFEWKNAVEAGSLTVEPWNSLIKRPVPMFKDYGLSNYIKTERVGDTIIAYLPYSAQVTPYFKIKAAKNQVIQVYSDTYSLGNHHNHNSIKTEYICSNGQQEYEMLHWISGHKIFYIIPSDVEIIGIQYRETGYNTEFAGWFSCDDKYLNSLWKKCQRTLYVCTHDYYMDCPDRERTQYAGDIANMINQSFFAFDTNIFALNKCSLERLFNWQRSDSTLYMPFGGTANEEIPLQSLYLTGYHGIYQYYLYSGDSALLREAFPSIKKYHALWKTDTNGLVEQRKGDWYWSDWGTNIDERLLDNVLFADALKGDMLIAEVLGEQESVSYYRKQYDDLKEAINKHYWNGKEYRSSGFSLPADDRGNAIAVLAGIADSSKYDLIGTVLTNNLYASTYMERFVLDALFKIGKTRDALSRMKSRYKEMVNSQYSTVWEQWTFDNPGNTTATYNHGWSGCPLHLLPQYIAGIQPLSPGFATYQIVPANTDISAINASVATLKGTIDVKISFEIWQYLMEIYSPPATIAKVGIPKKYYHQILKINGTIVRNTVNRKNRAVDNVHFVGEDRDYIYVELLPGKWLIEAF